MPKRRWIGAKGRVLVRQLPRNLRLHRFRMMHCTDLSPLPALLRLLPAILICLLHLRHLHLRHLVSRITFRRRRNFEGRMKFRMQLPSPNSSSNYSYSSHSNSNSPNSLNSPRKRWTPIARGSTPFWLLEKDRIPLETLVTSAFLLSTQHLALSSTRPVLV